MHPSNVVSETVFNPDLAIPGPEDTFCDKSGYRVSFSDSVLYTGEINQPVYSQPGNQNICSIANSTLESIHNRAMLQGHLHLNWNNTTKTSDIITEESSKPAKMFTSRQQEHTM